MQEHGTAEHHTTGTAIGELIIDWSTIYLKFSHYQLLGDTWEPGRCLHSTA